MSYERRVFINCPFDSKFNRKFQAIIFTVIDCGFDPHCALEIDDGAAIRLKKIMKLVAECKFGIHDLSRTQLDSRSKLPRFNMPLELGIFLGAKEFGRGIQAQKCCLIMDHSRFRYQKFISDIAGQDLRDHQSSIARLISHIRDWLQSAEPTTRLPGGGHIFKRYMMFERIKPTICTAMKLNPKKLTFADECWVIFDWLKQTAV
ncbi:MAG: hypothetical protein IT548_17985 [Alphaproteobacteria bacterium]|nr:hypothetical protein [Alphaproteobacteria bacterium]